MEGHQSEENGDYKKMIYRLLPGPNKMLPKVFMSKQELQNINHHSIY